MSHSITCDGCECHVPEEKAVVEGNRSKVDYCPECGGRYKAWEDGVFTKQKALAAEFEAFLKEQRAVLKASGFKKIPDDPEA